MLAARLRIADAEQDILDHMNSDHRESLVNYCRHVHGVEATTVEMVGVDCDGFDVRADNKIYRFDFESEARTAGDVRAALITLADAVRV